MDANTPPTDIGSKEGLRFKDLFRPSKEAPSYPVARADWHPSNIWATSPNFKASYDEYELVPLPLGESAEVEYPAPSQQIGPAKAPKAVVKTPVVEADSLTILVKEIVAHLLQPVRSAFMEERKRHNAEIADLVDSLAKRDARLDELSQDISELEDKLENCYIAFSRFRGEF